MNKKEIKAIVEVVLREAEPFLNTQAAADYLGVERTWLTRHVEIPRCKRGKLLYFRRSDLDNWITGR